MFKRKLGMGGIVTPTNDTDAALKTIIDLQQQGKLDEADRACRDFLQRWPNHPLATHFLGLLECRRGFTVQGLATLERSLALAPGNAEFHNNVAGVLGQFKRHHDAIAHGQRAVEFDPKMGLAYFNLGLNYEQLRDYAAAEKMYRSAVNFMPHHSDARYRLGCVLRELGKYRDSEYQHFRVFELAKVAPLPANAFPQLANPRIAVVVTCKGRLGHLKETLPQVLAFDYPGDYRVVVVDYADPDGAFEWCRSLRHPRLISMKVLDHAELFHKARAFNCGAGGVASDILAFIDADSVLDPRFLKQATAPLLEPGVVLTKREPGAGSDLIGVCCVRSAAYQAVRGYDEAIRSYGPEDMDFFSRLQQLGEFRYFPQEFFPRTLSHSQEERMRFYSSKDISSSTRQVVHRLMDKARTVNPTGYGKAQCWWAAVENNYVVDRRQLVGHATQESSGTGADAPSGFKT